MASTLDEKPEPGDLIEIDRGLYRHWAVYVGDGFVVHVTTPSDLPVSAFSGIMSVVADRAIVMKEELSKVAGNNKWKISNYLDEKYEPRSVDIIVKEALAQVGNEVPYSVTSKNCEHFATALRYGKPVSCQVENAENKALKTAVIIAAVGKSFAGHEKEENENRK